jgi:hypothetical protein
MKKKMVFILIAAAAIVNCFGEPGQESIVDSEESIVTTLSITSG